MKKVLFAFYFLIFSLSNMFAQAPDFSCVGFATMNGGTTGGQGGVEVTATNLAEFKQYVSETDATPRIIHIKGVLEGAGGGEIVHIGSNKTIIGDSDIEGKVLKVQFYCKNSKNLIFKNLFFSMEGSTLGSDADCISIATTSSGQCRNIWIDHCTFDNNIDPIYNASASLKDKYDGLLDIKKDTEYITISWCVFKNHYKGILVGYTDDDTHDRKITLHHNAFINIGSRTPSYRGGTAHIYNNYWDGAYDQVANKYFSTGVNTREEATLLVESNYFKNMDKTVYCALDDVTKEGFAHYRNNFFDNSTAETATTCSALTLPYTVIMEDVELLPQTIMQYAGVNVTVDTDTLDTPQLKEATNISNIGFDLEWNAIEAATHYIVNVSYEEQSIGSSDIFKETFNSLTTAVTKNALTSELTDNSSSKYRATGGGSNMACLENATMDLNGGRFSILGLDLSAASTLYLKCKYVSGSGKLLVHVDTEGTSGSGALYNAAASVIGSEYTTLAIPLTAATASSLIQIRTESSTIVRIDEISIVKEGGSSKTKTLSYTVDAPTTILCVSGLNENIEHTINVIAKNDSKTSAPSKSILVTTSIPVSIDNDAADKDADKYIVDVVGSDIIFKAEGVYKIYNFSGQLLKNGKSTSDYYTVPANLPKGIYIVVINGKSQKISIR